MICECLQQSEGVLVVDFNPINFQSSSESIVSLFFDSIISNLNNAHKDLEIKPYKKDYASIFGSTVKAASNICRFDLEGLTNNISDLRGAISKPANNKPVDVVRTEISELLVSSDAKIVVVIDDIDRLLPGEALQILKLIRVTACFDNMFYILGYDEDVLSKQIDPDVGEKYLEKFIQVPVRLPEPNHIVLQNMLYNEFIKTITDCGYSICKYTSFACNSISLKTIRELSILLNKFRIKMSMFPKDLCPEDLLVLTFIELKDPSLHHWLFENRFRLCRIHSENLQFLDLNGI